MVRLYHAAIYPPHSHLAVIHESCAPFGHVWPRFTAMYTWCIETQVSSVDWSLTMLTHSNKVYMGRNKQRDWRATCGCATLPCNTAFTCQEAVVSDSSIYPTWSKTYFRQDLFPTYLFFRRQFHAIVIFRLKSISDLDSGSLPRFLVWIHIRKIKKRGVVTRLDVKLPKLRSPLDKV